MPGGEALLAEIAALLAAAEADGVACAPLAERMAALKEFAAGLPPPRTAEE